MKLSTIQIALLGIAIAFTTALVLLFTGVIPGLREPGANQISGTLNVWGVFDSEKAINDSLIASFKTSFPNVNVIYTRFDERNYEQDLLNALAAGTGPDVFMIKNTWLIKHADKLSPLTETELPIAQYAQLFPEAVISDFTANGQMYAFPLYLDSLALFYNKKIFDNAGIAQPPQTWEDFKKVASRLTQFNSRGQITRAGAAIGSGSRNINEATSLLSLIMLQLGVDMLSPNQTSANFSRGNGLSALDFYTQFASPRSNAYVWEPSFHYSIDAFSEESTAMIFNYAFQIPNIKAKNPFLSMAVSPMPQFEAATNKINYANYFGLGVSKNSPNQTLAWQFVLNSTTDVVTNSTYLNATARPPALREVIALSINDPVVGIFSRQALTAASWPQIDAGAIDAVFSNMIDSINFGELSSQVAIKRAEEQVTALMKR